MPHTVRLKLVEESDGTVWAETPVKDQTQQYEMIRSFIHAGYMPEVASWTEPEQPSDAEILSWMLDTQEGDEFPSPFFLRVLTEETKRIVKRYRRDVNPIDVSDIL